MKLEKAAGVSEVVAKHEVASDQIGMVSTDLCNRLLASASENMQDKWRDSVLVLSYKEKGDARDCEAYGGLKFL